MKARLRQIFLDVLDELSLERVMADKLICESGVLQVDAERIDLEPFKKVLVAAIGKAAGPMARACTRPRWPWAW
jgi:hypothetical protein